MDENHQVQLDDLVVPEYAVPPYVEEFDVHLVAYRDAVAALQADHLNLKLWNVLDLKVTYDWASVVVR